MIIYWVLLIGILFQATTCEELDIDETVLTAEEEELLYPPATECTSAPIEDQTVNYKSPCASPGQFHFAEHFDNNEFFTRRWIKSTAKKDGMEERLAKYDEEWSVEWPNRQIFKGDLRMVLKRKAKHAADQSTDSSRYKKTDEQVPDDVNGQDSRASNKSDLDKPVDDEEEKVEEEEEIGENVKNQETESDKIKEAEPAPVERPNEGAKKRKPRKY